jgi:hypothetical protein
MSSGVIGVPCKRVRSPARALSAEQEWTQWQEEREETRRRSLACRQLLGNKDDGDADDSGMDCLFNCNYTFYPIITIIIIF